MEEKFTNAIMTLATAKKEESPGDSTLEKVMATFHTEIEAVRASISQAQTTRLEEKVTSLTSLVADAKQARVDQLEAQVAELKARPPVVTGRTEMDAVVQLGEKAIETFKDAGQGIKAVITAPQTAARFAPTRTTVNERVQTGEKLAATAEKQAAIAEKEKAFLME